jgi:hypothetical protein
VNHSSPGEAQNQPAAQGGSRLLSFNPAIAAEAAPLTVRVNGFATVTWQSTQATVLADATHIESAVQAVNAFQARHQALLALAQPLLELEIQASSDVPLCYRIESRDRHQWPRLQSLIHQLARTRLDIARLHGELASEPTGLTPPAAKLLRKLGKAAGVKAQLNRLSDRYEALEDLYEGAIDRINDHRYWRNGHVLEVIIIVVLLAEVLLLS